MSTKRSSNHKRFQRKLFGTSWNDRSDTTVVLRHCGRGRKETASLKTFREVFTWRRHTSRSLNIEKIGIRVLPFTLTVFSMSLINRLLLLADVENVIIEADYPYTLANCGTWLILGLFALVHCSNYSLWNHMLINCDFIPANCVHKSHKRARWYRK